MSPLLSWSPKYSVNNDELDSHHQKMFHILNTVYEDVMNSHEVDSFVSIIDNFLALARHHMSIEEQHMRENGYHDIDAHIETHREFSHKIETLRTTPHEDNLEAIKELIAVLGIWLLNHVIKEDHKYSVVPM
jgi:hemerythrin